jgi:putative transcriptional regulator
VVTQSPDFESSEPFVSLRGRLLLATPALNDDIFDQSVILIAEHTQKDGAVGAIINHPIGMTVGNLVSQLKDSPISALPVLRGGPVASEQLSFSSLSWNQKNKLLQLDRISAETAASAITRPDHVVQAIVGHSAWIPGQLEAELERHTWIILEPSAGLLRQPHDIDLWKRLLSSISPYHALLSLAPKHPILN